MTGGAGYVGIHESRIDLLYINIQISLSQKLNYNSPVLCEHSSLEFLLLKIFHMYIFYTNIFRVKKISNRIISDF